MKCQDYKGIQFVKKLDLLGDKQKQMAEVATYFKKFDEAEKIYKDIDRKDLAVELRVRLGDWFKVVQLVQVWLTQILLTLRRQCSICPALA